MKWEIRGLPGFLIAALPAVMLLAVSLPTLSGRLNSSISAEPGTKSEAGTGEVRANADSDMARLVTMSLHGNGAILLDGASVPIADLGAFLRAKQQALNGSAALIHVHRRSQFKDLKKVLLACDEAGIKFQRIEAQFHGK